MNGVLMKKNSVYIVLIALILTISLKAEVKYGSVEFKYDYNKAVPDMIYFAYKLPYFYNLDRVLQKSIYADLGLKLDKKDSLKASDIYDLIDDKFEEFEKGYLEAKSDMYDLPGYSTDFTYQFKELYHFLNLTTINFSFFGGAHPNTSVGHFVYNLKTNKKVELSDIIKDMKSFTELAEQEFRKLYKIEVGYPLSSVGFMFENDKFSMAKQFYIENDGIVLFWDTYEIAAYAYGPITLKVKYKDFNNNLKEPVLKD